MEWHPQYYDFSKNHPNFNGKCELTISQTAGQRSSLCGMPHKHDVIDDIIYKKYLTKFFFSFCFHLLPFSLFLFPSSYCYNKKNTPTTIFIRAHTCISLSQIPISITVKIKANLFPNRLLHLDHIMSIMRSLLFFLFELFMFVIWFDWLGI